MTVFVGAHIDESMLEPLNLLCKHFHRSKSFLIGDAIKRYIAEKLEEIEEEREAEEALEIMNDSNGVYYTTSEILKRLEAKG